MACPVSAQELCIKEKQQISISQNSFTQSTKDYRTVSLHQPSALTHPSSPHNLPRTFCYWQRGNMYEQIIYICCLAISSYLGVLCRIYLSELSRWDGVPYFSSIYAQMVGTLIMGFIISHRLTLAKNYSFIYQAITTGLCGSITTFSSWNLEAVSSLLQTGEESPDNTTRMLGWITTLLLGLGMSAGALSMGTHIAALSPWSDQRVRDKQLAATAAVDPLADDTTPFCHIGLKGSVLVYVSLWLAVSMVVVAVAYMALHKWDLIFSILFAALGTYCRWHLAPLNATFNNFKLGTFLVNIVGAWLLGGVISAQSIYPDGWIHNLLVGIATGFCGCLTTVSTFTVELFALPLRYAYIYAISSILAAQTGLLLIRGPIQWTQE